MRHTYAWDVTAHIDEVVPGLMPRWLLTLVTVPGRSTLPRDGTPLVLREGERNHRLHQLASLLRRYGLGERAICGCLEVINREHATPPLDPDEVARIAASAARYTPAPSPFLDSAAFLRRASHDDDFEAVVGAALRTSS
jgi:hypothetical protein